MQGEWSAATGQGSCGTLGGMISTRRKIFLIRCQVSRKDICHIKLEIVRTGVTPVQY